MKKVSNNPLISVIVPVYKVEDYLDKCVESIINQTYDNLEIILVDDGSPDNCPKMCDDWAKKDKRIKVIHKKNGGLSDARNVGIEKSTGEYITFVDSDDYVTNEYVENLYETIIRFNADISISSHEIIYSTGKVIYNATYENKVLDPKEVLERILYSKGLDLSAWAKLYKKDLFKDIRFPVGRIFEDSATTYRLIDKSKIISIGSIPTYKYIIRNNSISNCNFSPKKMDLITSTTEMCNYISNKYPDLSRACERRQMYAYLSTLSQLANSDKKYPKEKKMLVSYIMANGNSILKDKYAPIRDKMAILSLKFGFNFYKFIWRLYKKITRRF